MIKNSMIQDDRALNRTHYALAVDMAPGNALKSMIMEWQKNSNVKIDVNVYQLPLEDREWLSQQKNIGQVNFDPLDEDVFIQHYSKVGGYSIITTRLNIPFKKKLLAKFSSKEHTRPLKIIGQAGSTVSHIDLIAATECNIAVTYTPGANANAVAEYVLAQIFNLTRSLIFYNQASHEGIWAKYLKQPMDELNEKVLGIIGYGHIGKVVSNKAAALGMPIMVYSRNSSQQSVNDKKMIITSHIHDLLGAADIISLHVPFTSETNNLISAKEISMMKRGAFIINTSRGGIVDENAIAAELLKPNPKLAGVAFDVFEDEGRKFNSPLIGCKNAILTPHIAGTTNAALSRAAVQMVINIIAIINESNPFIANPAVLNNISYFNNSLC